MTEHMIKRKTKYITKNMAAHRRTDTQPLDDDQPKVGGINLRTD